MTRYGNKEYQKLYQEIKEKTKFLQKKNKSEIREVIADLKNIAKMFKISYYLHNREEYEEMMMFLDIEQEISWIEEAFGEKTTSSLSFFPKTNEEKKIDEILCSYGINYNYETQNLYDIIDENEENFKTFSCLTSF